MDYSIAKIKDKIKFFEKTGKIVSTNFLTPAEIVELSGVLKKIPFATSGGFEEVERKIIIVGTFDECIQEFCTVIRIVSKMKELSHREVLGSILGLGIKREMIGDIIVSEKTADVVIMNEMKEYILNNLQKIGREKVTVSEIDFENILKIENNKVSKNVSVASLRLDAVVSSAFGISREKSAELIKLEKVLVDYIPCTNISKSIKESNLISVRGYGRIRVLEVLGETRKGRIRITIEVY